MRDTTEIDGSNARARIQLLPDGLAALLPADGVLTFLLTLAIIYITVVSIQAVRPVWADGLQVLTPAMLFGVVAGYIAIKQDAVRGNLMHLLTLIAGCVIAFFLTANAVLAGDRLQLWTNFTIWVQRSLLHQQVSNDNSVFVLFLTLLTYLLAYLTIWLIFIARRPWLALVANSVVLLIDMSQSQSDQYYFLVVFLVLTLLLLVRFALAENVRQWKHIGLRFSPDLSWDFMQAGAIFAVIVALLPNLLPFAQPNQSLLTYLSSDQSPITQIQERLQNLFGGVNGRGYGSYSFFDSSLQLVGSVYLPDTPILRYTLPDGAHADSSQYLMTEIFANYDGVGNWSRDQIIDQGVAAHQVFQPSSPVNHLDTYRITFLVTPSGGQRFIFTPGSSAESFNVDAETLVSATTGEPITYEAESALPLGSSYVATGYVSSATVDNLKSVPYPGASAKDSQGVYPPNILGSYAPTDEKIDPYIVQKAKEVTQGAKTMYDAATDIENYLHSNFVYNAHNPNPPANQDATVWFLQRKEGFCTFFASAMALMGRALGMPTRVVSGYATGSYDSKTNSFIVRGTQAHTWTQVYFGQYGWINFEPTASFSPFARTVPNGQTTGPLGSDGTPVASPTTPLHGLTGGNGNTGQVNTGGPASTLVSASIDFGVLALLALIATALLAWWWRSLFKGYTPVANGLARLTMLGVWAGVRPKRSQTPREYADQLAEIAPVQREALAQVGALYSRERWGRPLDGAEQESSKRHYERGRRALVSVIVRRVGSAPMTAFQAGRRFIRSRRERA